MFDIITIGGATRDIFFQTDQGKILSDPNSRAHTKYLGFEYGAKIIPEVTDFSYGGGGANTAISFARLGLKTAAILRIGIEGTGSLIVKELHRAGVNCEFIERDHVNHTALTVIVSVPGRDHTMYLYRGSNDFLTVRDWRPIKTKWFYISSLTGESAEVIPEAFSYARAHHIKIAWNPGSQQLEHGFKELEHYLEQTDVLILNREEAIKLVLSKNNRIKINDEKELLKALHEMTKGEVVVTDGENGSYVSDGKTDYFQPTMATEVLETTGAGDAYGSTYVASRIQGFGIQGSMKFATRNSANVVRFVGAQKGLMTFDNLRCKIEVGGEHENS